MGRVWVGRYWVARRIRWQDCLMTVTFQGSTTFSNSTSFFEMENSHFPPVFSKVLHYSDYYGIWPPDVKSWLSGKDSDAGKDWGQEENRATEDEMVEWHHRLNGHEFEQALGDSEGQGSLMCCSPSGRKESDTTEQLNNNNNSDWSPLPLFLLSRLPCLSPSYKQRVGHDWATELNWTDKEL